MYKTGCQILYNDELFSKLVKAQSWTTRPRNAVWQ